MPYLFQKLGKMSQDLSSAVVVIGALRVNLFETSGISNQMGNSISSFKVVG